MRAFATAAQMGADGIEIDIFLTRDQKIVVTHNNSTWQITREKFLVRRSTLAELRRLDFGRGEKIPALEEVFEAFLPKFAVINVEIKSTGLRTDGIEERLAMLIRRFDSADKVLVSSFNPFNLQRFRRCSPAVRIGYLMCPEQTVAVKNRRVIGWLNPDTLNLDQNLLAIRRYQPLFQLAKPQWIWTVNTVNQMQTWLKRKQVEAIITNHPDKLIQVKEGKFGKI
jgi:glycerophosphoryl diester phosphodiesterase